MSLGIFVTTLECAVCGGAAIYREDGLFAEDEGDACMTCGHPGHVSVEEDGTAWWNDAGDCASGCVAEEHIGAALEGGVV